VSHSFRAAAAYINIRITTIVGGIAPPKQQKRLAKRPEIVVATPGRLWEHMSNCEEHLQVNSLLRPLFIHLQPKTNHTFRHVLSQVTSYLRLQDLSALSFVVIDEADRMIEKGHFEELQRILSFLPYPNRNSKRKEISEAGAMQTTTQAVPRQTFVFSATLTLPESLRKRLKLTARRDDDKHGEKSEGVRRLFEHIEFRGSPSVIDLTKQGIGLPAKLQEAAVECVADQKDALLYYLLVMHPGRCLVFCNATNALKRLTTVLSLLQLPVNSMHSGMQQRQRLKAIDRFKQKSDAVLVATDVAARGIDIAGVRMVVHYHLAQSAEVYLHRCGRTARAKSDGISIALIAPADKSKYNKLYSALGRDEPLPRFPIEQDLLQKAETRVSTAAKIERLDKSTAKARSAQSWIERKAREMDQFNDEDDNIDADDLENHSVGRKRTGDSETRRSELKAELSRQLKTPLKREAPSARYPTKESSQALASLSAASKEDAVALSKKRGRTSE